MHIGSLASDATDSWSSLGWGLRLWCKVVQKPELTTCNILFIYLFKNSTQYEQYKIEDTIKAVEF